MPTPLRHSLQMMRNHLYIGPDAELTTNASFQKHDEFYIAGKNPIAPRLGQNFTSLDCLTRMLYNVEPHILVLIVTRFRNFNSSEIHPWCPKYRHLND